MTSIEHSKYRIVYRWHGGRIDVGPCNIRSLAKAQQTAATLMPPKGYLRPDTVEIRSGEGRPAAAGGIEWTDHKTVDTGTVDSNGRIAWHAEPVAKPKDPISGQLNIFAEVA